MPRLAAEGYPCGGSRYSERKSQPRRPPLTPNMAKAWRMASAPTPPARPASPRWPMGWMTTLSRVDLLVYSAGIAKAAFISDFALGDFDRSLQVNLVGYFLCAREFSRLMIRDGIKGRIIQINSKSGKVGSTTPATARRSSAASG